MLMASTFCRTISRIEFDLATKDNVDNVIDLVRLEE
jgi:hypothetical protein